jgi:hypothetical protein
MIRASDLSNAVVWTGSSVTTPAARAGAREGSGWFEDGAANAAARISGDVNPATRGLSVEQHASLVLAHLCAEGDVRR